MFSLKYAIVIYMKLRKPFAATILFLGILIVGLPVFAATQTVFDPNFIISDPELWDYQSWSVAEVQSFLESKGSYLATYRARDIDGFEKTAGEIIFAAAERNQVSPKYIVVTLQKEQSLITDDSPSQKQLDWATGYAVCDSCSRTDPKVAKHRGFAQQVDNAAGIMRWYNDHREGNSVVLKKGTLVRIDDQEVIPQSWATAFLYTYTPHLHGNKNFARIWTTWFSQVYPDGTLLKTIGSNDIWLLQNGLRRRFKNQAVLVSRADPKLIVPISDVDLSNYQVGQEILFPNYSLLRAPSGTYLLDFDSLRPFASAQVMAKLGFNPDEVVDVSESDLSGLVIGPAITDGTAAPQGVVYQITDLKDRFYLFKDSVLYPITDPEVIKINYAYLAVEKKTIRDLATLTIADQPVKIQDGSLIQPEGSPLVYVVEKGRRRRITDDDTFAALGYKRANVSVVKLVTILNIPEGEPLFLNSSLMSSRNKFLGDVEGPVTDQFKSTVPAYVVAEYPSGRIIAGKNIDEFRTIASLTKLLTTYEALHQSFKPTAFTAFDSKKYPAEKNVLQFKAGEKVKNQDLLGVALVGSVNPVAQMLAAASAETEKSLLDRIGQRLEDWGADNTAVSDVTGLSENNKSSARDLLKIFTKVTSDQTLGSLLGKSTYSFTTQLGTKKIAHEIKNTNQLFFKSGRSYKIIASKSGYTTEAGALLAMVIEPAAASTGNSTLPKLSLFLEKGNKGKEVSALQKRLLAAGFFPLDQEITELFGDTTEVAVKKFQAAEGLPVAGYVGPATRNALNKVVAASTSTTATKRYVIITLGNADYPKRFDEPNRLAELVAKGKFSLTGN